MQELAPLPRQDARRAKKFIGLWHARTDILERRGEIGLNAGNILALEDQLGRPTKSGILPGTQGSCSDGDVFQCRLRCRLKSSLREVLIDHPIFQMSRASSPRKVSASASLLQVASFG